MKESNAAFVSNEIKNYHASQKWMWSLLMVLTLVESTKRVATKGAIFFESMFSDAETPISGYDPQTLTATSADFPITVLFYLLFLSIIYRFYVGDNRIVDYYYDSLPAAFAKAEKKELFPGYVRLLSPGVFFWNSSIRVMQYLLFVVAATNLDDLRRFVWSVVILLVVNVVFSAWLLIYLRFRKAKRAKLIEDMTEKELGERWHFFSARRIWLFNNLVWSAAIAVAMIGLNVELALYAALFFLLLNSVIDVIFCRDVYFPRFEKFC